ncbi:DUF4129 domain-containing protein [Stieleria sp. TO1_6]|uniref:DUF4129 domain-containing protein n=1 Tax=Stieleria tagensis TaxID=2956795 RepID=UPI00209AD0EE|nr:DUF4129 domain-containing protein [Stieleria tagensis]MCO8121406.1 DUF4129 domain-containing protein [Stieleria tagensis]
MPVRINQQLGGKPIWTPLCSLAIVMVTMQMPAIGDATPAVDVSKTLSSSPWYDASSNQIRPIPIRPRVDDSIHRNSRWLPKPKKLSAPDVPNASNLPTGTKPQTNSGILGTSLTWTNLFGWALLAATLFGIVGIIVYALSRAELGGPANELGSANSRTSGLPDQQMLERIKHLPPELRRTDVNLRSECQRLMQQGRFDQAIILLLGHQLLLLDRAGILRLARGKTNGGYVRETRSNMASCAPILRATADAFEQSYFGRHEITSDVFAEIWEQNAQLESAVQMSGAAV